MRPKYYCLTKKGAHAACWQRALIMMMISQYTAGGPNERKKTAKKGSAERDRSSCHERFVTS